MFRLRVLIIFFFVLLGSVFSYADEPNSKENSGKVNLGKVVVSASKIEQLYRDVPNNISVITKEDLESEPVNEFTEAINLLPSINVLDYGSIGSARSVQARGSSNTQVLTLVDGRPLNTPRDGATDFNQISLSNIERIEVLRGPASSIYGANAVGGVINIITKKGSRKMQTDLLVKQGSFATTMESFTNSWKIKDFDYFVSYDYINSHGFRENSGYLSHNVNSKLGYEFNKDNRISFSSGYFKSKVNNPGSVTRQDLNDRSDTYKNFFDLTYDGKILGAADILVKLYNNKDRLEFIETPYPVQKDTHQTKVYGADSQFSYKFSDFLRASFGLDYQDNRLNSSTSGRHTYNVKSIYSEAEIDLLDKINCKLGIRLDDYSNFGNAVSPSGGLNFWLSDKIKIHGLAAKAFRAPTFNDLYWPRTASSSGNPDLGPEKAFSFEGGFSTYFLDNLDTDITFFKTKYRNLIAWVADNNNFWTPSNLGSAFTRGIELEVNYSINNKLKANCNYTYLEAEDTQIHKNLTYRPKHLIKTRITYLPVQKLEITMNCLYKTRVFSNSTNTTTVGAYFIMNLNFAYNLNKFTQVIFEAKNIFDRSYQEIKDYSMPGRSFYGGLRLNF